MDRKEQHKRDLLRRWISGELTAREEAELRRAAQEDEVLRDAFAGYEATAEEDHAARLARLRSKTQRSAGAKRRPLVVWRAAAAVLLLLAAAWWLIPNVQDNAMSAPMAMEESSDADEGSAFGDSEAEDLILTEQAAEPAIAAGDESPEIDFEDATLTIARDDTPVIESDDELIAEALNEITTEESAPGGAAPDFSESFTTTYSVPIDQITANQLTDSFQVEYEADAVAIEVEEAPADPLEVSPPAPPPAAAKRSFPTQNQGYPTRLEDRMRATNAGPVVANNGFRVIEGKVLDGEGYPLIGASVIEQGTANGTITDFDGFYRIAVAENQASLLVNYTGYESQLVDLAEENELDIIMAESVALLDEVVVTGLGARQERQQASVAGSVGPTGGFRALRRYINDQTPVNTPRARIRVQFVVQADGSLTNLEVLNSTNTAYNDFAVELLQNGPAWQIEEGEAPIKAVYVVRLKG